MVEYCDVGNSMLLSRPKVYSTDEVYYFFILPAFHEETVIWGCNCIEPMHSTWVHIAREYRYMVHGVE